MNLTTPADSAEAQAMSRREAIKRAALLLGVALTPSLLTGVMQAATAAAAAYAKPVYLSAKQFETVRIIADRILPRTDTPGALDVGVPAFIDLMFGKYLVAEDQKIVAVGLADVETASRTAHQKDFAQLTGTQQDALLTTIAEASKTKTRTFFHQIKELTVLGYFTCESVGKNVLNYDPVPGRFDACIPLTQVGNKTWTKER